MKGKWLDNLCDHIGVLQAGQSGGPLFVGVYGPQGSGKTTLSEQIRVSLCKAGIGTLAISLDDFYLSKIARELLSKKIHPLLKARGVPGTHDLALAQQVFDDLLAGRDALVPKFDKSADDIAPKQEWVVVSKPLDVIILEGWCVGVPDILRKDDEENPLPLNSVEQEQDPKGIWRAYVAEQNCHYQKLYQQIQFMIGLRIPAFSFVAQWRWQQECALYQKTGKRYFNNLSEVKDFVALFERVTRVAQGQLEAFADCIIDVGEGHAWNEVRYV